MSFEISVDGKPVVIPAEDGPSVVRVEPGVYSVLLNGQSFEVCIASPSLTVNGRRFTVEVRDPRDSSPRTRAAHGGGRQKITAPMPGKVIRVLVGVGDAVEMGQGLVVVEAMKMQNEMKASRPGRVTELLVHDGDTVASGDTLVVLE